MLVEAKKSTRKCNYLTVMSVLVTRLWSTFRKIMDMNISSVTYKLIPYTTYVTEVSTVRY